MKFLEIHSIPLCYFYSYNVKDNGKNILNKINFNLPETSCESRIEGINFNNGENVTDLYFPKANPSKNTRLAISMVDYDIGYGRSSLREHLRSYQAREKCKENPRDCELKLQSQIVLHSRALPFRSLDR